MVWFERCIQNKVKLGFTLEICPRFGQDGYLGIQETIWGDFDNLRTNGTLNALVSYTKQVISIF